MNNNPVNLNKIGSTITPPAQTPSVNDNKVNAVEAVASSINSGKSDTLELGYNTQESFGTYKIDRQKLNQIKLDFKKNSESFKEMVRAMIEKQGFKANQVLKAIDDGEEPLIEVDAETRAKATEAISEDGYWGVNQTSARLLDFAKTISGGDPTKIELLKNAFKEGFEQAKEAFGGELPEISEQTYQKVMEGFDAWENGDA